MGFVTFYQTRLEVSTDMSWHINAALNIFILGRGRKSLVFRAISWSSGAMIRPDSLLCGHFLVLDLDRQSDIAFLCAREYGNGA
jgi:hypothetical protein